MRPTAVFAIALIATFLAFLASCKKDLPDPVTPPSNNKPSIVSFTPAQGPEGAAVEISGENFSTDPSKVSVVFNGKAAEVISSTMSTITTRVPDGATSGKISVSIGESTAVSSSDFVVNPAAPSVTAITPEIAESGATIELTGTNFSTGAKVYIGVVEATNAVVISSTKITATLPAGVTTAKVKVMIGNLQAESPQVLYIKPTIVAVSPLVAPQEALVTVRGTNFIEGETAVKFGAINVDKNDVYFVSSTEIKVKVPAGLPGTPVKIAVTMKGQEVQSTESFTLLNAISFTPSAKGGEAITITGSGFSATGTENVVKINDVTATVTASTQTTISVIVPMGVGSGFISVSRGGYTVVTSDRFHYEYTLMVSTYAGGIGALSNPSAVVIDKNGNMFVADQYHHVIRKITGGVLTTFAGAGTAGFSNGSGTAAKFNYPTGLAVDAAGNVYVADLGNQMIRKISPSGLVSTVAGEPEKAGSNDGIGGAARFHSPMGLAVDNANNLYVADAGNHLIRKISPAGEVITLAGRAGVVGNANGATSAATFNYPAGIAIDAGGTLYVADEGNHEIRKVTPSGAVTTVAGAGSPGYSDGHGTAAKFHYPNGIIIHYGTLYITDASNHLIRTMSPAGIVSTLAGMPGIPGDTNGIPEASRFDNPSGIALDANGIIYVADKSNHKIRKLSMQ
jgi:sugar lactone lactonase YvrE